MGSIKQLSDIVINQIAAGEVIERPASVVKELVENALDAGATEVLIELENSGKSLIRISDNGCGMDEDDLRLSIERHATSKLSSAEDLQKISTLGFRGEALPSIASVSRLSISSSTGSSKHGWELTDERELRPGAREMGTTVTVRNLFENIPVRKKFLKSDSTELTHIKEMIDRIALSFPTVRFTLQHYGRILCDYFSVTHPLDRVREVMKGELKEISESELIPLEENKGDLAVQGILWPSKIAKPTNSRLVTLVNRRVVKDRLLTHAVVHGYRTLLPGGMFPVAVIYLDIDPALVDVNVHPTKSEVRFLQPGMIHDLVAKEIQHALSGYRGIKIEIPPQDSFPYPQKERREFINAVHEFAPLAPTFSKVSMMERAEEKGAVPFSLIEGVFNQLRIVGQAARSYIVCEKEGALVVIDQHAAHERVRFEELRKQVKEGNVPSQLLLVSEWLVVSEQELGFLIEMKSFLERLGLELEPFGKDSISIKAVPSILGTQPPKALVESLLKDLMSISGGQNLESHLHDVLATIACHSAIRFGQELSMSEMKSLLSQLDRVELISNCPHGRPIVLEIPLKTFEKALHRG